MTLSDLIVIFGSAILFVLIFLGIPFFMLAKYNNPWGIYVLLGLMILALIFMLVMMGVMLYNG